jgi:hypothetical protein
MEDAELGFKVVKDLGAHDEIGAMERGGKR